MTTLPGLAGGTRLRVTLFGCRAHPLSLSTHSRCHAPRSDREKNRAWVKTIGSFISCLRGPCVVSGLQSLMATWYQDDGDSNARREARPAAQWSQVGDPFLSPLQSSYRDLLDPPLAHSMAWSRSSHSDGRAGAAATSLCQLPLSALSRIGGRSS